MNTARRLLLLALIVPGFCAYFMISSSGRLPAGRTVSAAEAANDTDGRLREGTTVDLQGSFKLTGDRIMFYSGSDQRRFGTLENLNLERIADLVSDNPEPLEWSIRATVTEFQGTNNLLITRAVLKSKPQRRQNTARSASELQGSSR